MTKGAARSRTGTAPPAESGVRHWLLWGGVLAIGIIIGLMTYHALQPVEHGETGTDNGLLRVDSIEHEHGQNHVHGIGYDGERDRLYVATHFGLFMIANATGAADELYQVGTIRHDLMGFSLDPHDSDRMYASGHPYPRTMGGPMNLGLIHSTDGGMNWTQVWDGPDRNPVDFHAMAVSGVDRDRIIGSWGPNLYLTLDAGNTWETREFPPASMFCWGAPCISWDAVDADRLWIGTGEGIYTSTELGADWQLVREGPHAGVWAHPADNTLWAWDANNQTVIRFDDNATTWQTVTEGLHPQAHLFAFTGGTQDPDVLFGAFHDGAVYRTLDAGQTWEPIRLS